MELIDGIAQLKALVNTSLHFSSDAYNEKNDCGTDSNVV